MNGEGKSVRRTSKFISQLWMSVHSVLEAKLSRAFVRVLFRLSVALASFLLR